MSELQEARERLEEAVTSLERLIAGLVMSSVDVQERCVTLEDQNTAVGNRLDAAIKRLRTVLDA